MVNHKYKIGIALATYNPDFNFLDQQLLSILTQSHQNWVCVISDDSTSTIARDAVLQASKVDVRFRYVINPTSKGVFRNFENALINLPSDIEFICFCDQDDIWERSKIEKLLEVLIQNPASRLAHSDLSIVNEQGKEIAESCWTLEKRNILSRQTLADLVIRNSVTGCSLMFDRALIDLALPFPSNTDIEYLHDHWIAVIAKSVSSIIAVPESLVRYRQHARNVVGAAQRQSPTLRMKIENLKYLVGKSRRALLIRQKLAAHLLNRLNENYPLRRNQFEQELLPILMPKAGYFLTGLVRTRGRWPEFGLWLQLFIGSLLAKK